MTMAQHDPSYTDEHLSRQAPSALSALMRGLRLLVGLDELDERPRARRMARMSMPDAMAGDAMPGSDPLADRLFAEDQERSADPYAHRIARSFDLLDPLECADVHCSFIDSEIGDLASHAYWLDQHMEMSVAPMLDATAMDARVRAGGRHLLVVNIDTFHSLDDAVPALVGLRRRHPKLAVVVASSRFHRHDFGSDRLALADASVRLPASRATIEIAVSHALAAASRRRLIL